MKKIPLIDYVQEHGQTETASRLGLTQGAVWQMLNRSRVVVIVEDDGVVTFAYEERPIGRFRGPQTDNAA